MVIKNWRERFDELMLHRGEDYWRKGRVTKLNYTADEILAVVEGSAPYDVDILLNKGEISDMTCTCPYAEENEYCKHMAAVLFAAVYLCFLGKVNISLFITALYLIVISIIKM